MITALTILAAVLTSEATVSAAAQNDRAEAIIADARDRMLAGDALPPDLEMSLRALPPAERLRVIAFLRRAGLLTGPGRSADWLLAPAQGEEMTR